MLPAMLTAMLFVWIYGTLTLLGSWVRSLHGLIRAENMEVGRDSDTGGQVKYVVELARVHLLHVLVMEMLILAIL
ncbi:hypothetical protein L2E82_13749 [Cichorium intybus]|uniref:Uncharacterized protein n=1 Tax=Cichorium intybus TaxID=13427 RepID=A0ACB9EZC8_CICIN|nr:hypothetical protein L2E82_13749 [Cichorium intybus]